MLEVPDGGAFRFPYSLCMGAHRTEGPPGVERNESGYLIMLPNVIVVIS